MSAHALDSPLPIGAEPAASFGSGNGRRWGVNIVSESKRAASRGQGQGQGQGNGQVYGSPQDGRSGTPRTHTPREHDSSDKGSVLTPVPSGAADGDIADLNSLDGVGSEGVALLAVHGHRLGDDVISIRSPDASTLPGHDHDGGTVLTFGTLDDDLERDSLTSPAGSRRRRHSSDIAGLSGTGSRLEPTGGLLTVESPSVSRRSHFPAYSKSLAKADNQARHTPLAPDPAVGIAAKCLSRSDGTGAAVAWSSSHLLARGFVWLHDASDATAFDEVHSEGDINIAAQ